MFSFLNYIKLITISFECQYLFFSFLNFLLFFVNKYTIIFLEVEVMKRETTSARLKQLMKERNLKQIDILRKCEPVSEKYTFGNGKKLKFLSPI